MKSNYRNIKTTILVTLIVLSLFVLFLNRTVTPDKETMTLEKKLTISYQTSDPTFSKVMDTIIQTYQEKNPNIKIISSTLQEQNFPVTEEKNLYLTDAWPDLIELSDFQTANYLDIITPYPQELVSTINKNELILDHTNNIWLAPTRSFSTSQYYRIYYNKQLFHELGLTTPKSYDDFLTICQTLKGNNIVPLGFSGANYRTIQTLFTMLLGEFIQEQPTFFQQLDQGSLSFSDEYLALFEKEKELVSNYSSNNWQSTTEAGAISDFQNRKTAMLITSSFIEPVVSDSTYFQLDYFLMPGKEENSTYVINNAFPSGWGLSKSAMNDPDKKEALLDFLVFYYSEESQEIFSNFQVFAPKLSTTPENIPENIEKRILRFDKQLAPNKVIGNALPFAEISYLYQFFTIQNQLLYQYMVGEIPKEKVAEQLQNEFEHQREEANNEK